MTLFFVKITGRGITDCAYLAHKGYTALTMVAARWFTTFAEAELKAAEYRRLGYVQKFEVVEL